MKRRWRGCFRISISRMTSIIWASSLWQVCSIIRSRCLCWWLTLVIIVYRLLVDIFWSHWHVVSYTPYSTFRIPWRLTRFIHRLTLRRCTTTSTPLQPSSGPSCSFTVLCTSVRSSLRGRRRVWHYNNLNGSIWCKSTKRNWKKREKLHWKMRKRGSGITHTFRRWVGTYRLWEHRRNRSFLSNRKRRPMPCRIQCTRIELCCIKVRMI